MTTTDTSEHPLLAGIRDIAKATSAVRDLMTFTTDPHLLGDAVLDLVDASTAIDGLRAELVGLAESNGTPHTAGVRTMGQFVGSQTNRSPATTRRDASLHRWLHNYTTFADAYFTGQITGEHVAALKRLENARTSALLRGDQQFFVDAAIDVETFKDFETVCDYWLITVDPDGEEPIEQLKANAVRFRRGSGGRGTVSMDLDAVSFDAAKKMIDHRGGQMRSQIDPDQDAPSPSHVRYGATMSLLVDGFARADGTLPTPIVNVVMSQQVVEWAQGQLNGDDPTVTVPVDAFDVDGRSELIGGTPVHPLLLASFANLWQFTTPQLRRYVLNAKSRILDYSYNARIHPEHLRTASMIEHRGRCGTKGCDAPEHWLQMDHVEPHSKGGPTSLPNTVPLCWPDNYAKGDRPGFGRTKRPPNDKDADDPDG